MELDKSTDKDMEYISTAESSLITLDELLSSESEVLKRIGRELEGDAPHMAGHQSRTSGHSSIGSHSSHSSSMVENPIEE